MKKRTPKIKLMEYVEQFLAARDVSLIYQMQIRWRCANLCRWAGRELYVHELSCELVNAWLVNVKNSDLAASTAHTYRANVLAVWNEAYQDGLNDNPPLRVRKIKRSRLIVEAYNHAEIRQLLAGAETLSGYDLNGNRRADFWCAAICGAYSSGLRRGDLLNVPIEKVSDAGIYTAIQHKTAGRVTVQFCADTLRYAAKLRSPNGVLVPWPYRLDSFAWAFQRVRKAAGINRGSFCWLRRSAGSYAESIQPGAGPKALGHRGESVFRNHYEDQAITILKPFSPPSYAPPIQQQEAV